jgi:hypothetical protein
MKQISNRDYQLLLNKLPALLSKLSVDRSDIKTLNDVRQLKALIKKMNKAH